MKLKLLLFKDSDCDNCKLIQEEFIDNPPKCDVIIIHAKHNYNKELLDKYEIKVFPTSVLIDEDLDIKIDTFEGFVDSEFINHYINEYETKRLV